MGNKKGFQKWLVSSIILLIIGIGAFVYLNPKESLKLVLPDLDNISLVKINIKNDTAYLNVDVVLENKSIFKLAIDTLFYELTLADSPMFSEKKVLNFKQTPGELSTVKMPLRISITKTVAIIKSLQHQDSVDVEIRSYAIYNTIFGRQKIPVTKKIKIKVPIPPRIILQEMEVEDIHLSDKTIHVLLKVKLINDGEMIDLNIHKIHYKFELGDDKLISSDGLYNKPIALRPKSEKVIDIPVTIKINHVIKAAWKYVTNEKLSYTIFATAELDENNFYNKANIPLEIKATGKAKLRKKK